MFPIGLGLGLEVLGWELIGCPCLGLGLLGWELMGWLGLGLWGRVVREGLFIDRRKVEFRHWKRAESKGSRALKVEDSRSMSA